MKLKHERARNAIAHILEGEDDGLTMQCIEDRMIDLKKEGGHYLTSIPNKHSLSNLMFRDKRFRKANSVMKQRPESQAITEYWVWVKRNEIALVD